MKIQAVIFDLNGTILDDEDNYGRAFNRVLKTLGVQSSTDYPHESGVGVMENWIRFKRKFSIKTEKSLVDLSRETQEEYLRHLDEISVRSGFFEFARELKESGISIALATSNTWEVADEVINKVGLAEVFDAVTTSEEVVNNKPDPDIFLLAADKVFAEREHCLVIEDAPAGILAAHRAGMKVVAIARDEEHAELLSKADLVVEGFMEITPQKIAEI